MAKVMERGKQYEDPGRLCRQAELVPTWWQRDWENLTLGDEVQAQVEIRFMGVWTAKEAGIHPWEEWGAVNGLCGGGCCCLIYVFKVSCWLSWGGRILGGKGGGREMQKESLLVLERDDGWLDSHEWQWRQRKTDRSVMHCRGWPDWLY